MIEKILNKLHSFFGKKYKMTFYLSNNSKIRIEGYTIEDAVKIYGMIERLQLPKDVYLLSLVADECLDQSERDRVSNAVKGKENDK